MRKLPCVERSIEDVIEEKVEKVVAKKLAEPKNVGVILNLVQSLHDIMREKAAITGQKAYYDIIRLLLLRFIEPHLKEDGRLSNLLDAKHYESIENFDSAHIKYLNFTELVTSIDMDFEDKIYLVWSMLSMYPFTSPVFPKNKAFNSPPEVLELACKKIYKSLEEVHFDELDEDVGGAIYEHFVNKKGGGGGQSLGQYFTPRKLINLIMKLNKEIFPKKKPKNIYDPCAGTAGFLMEMYKAAKVDSEEIYGGELESDTFANCLMNIMLTTGSIGNVSMGDSLRNNSTKLYDWIGTNPPFGVKSKYEDVLANVEHRQPPVMRGKTAITTCISAEKMYPIKTNDGSALFLQHCIAKLAYGGMCNIVLPAGQLLTGKNAYAKLRQYLIQDCVLHAVLAVPGGVFDNAGVSTVVIFFSKSKDSSTGDVYFYETDLACQELKELGTVHQTDMEEKNYVLDWKYYKQVDVFRPVDSSWEVKTLGDICTLVKGKHSSTKTETNSAGLSKFITVAKMENWQNCDITDSEEEALFVSNVSSGILWPIHYYRGAHAYCDLLRRIDTADCIRKKYLYYFLLLNVQPNIEKYIKGCANKSLDVDAFNAIQIPIPSLEKQQEIIAKCEEYDRDIATNKKLIDELEASKATFRKVYVDPLFTRGEVKTLGEVCDVMYGTRIVKKSNQEGEFPVYGGGDATFTTTTFNRENKTCKISRFALTERNCVQLIDEKYFLNDSGFTIKSSTSDMIDTYLWYYLLSIKNVIYESSEGAAQRNMNMEKFNAIQIPVPSLEVQQQIVQKYDSVYNCITNTNILVDELERQKMQYLKESFNYSS